MARDWDAVFAKYDKKHPELYRYFEKFALELLHAGRRRISHGTIVERIRWQTAITGEQFRVNQNFGRPMAERFVREHPGHAGVFEFRGGGPAPVAPPGLLFAT